LIGGAKIGNASIFAATGLIRLVGIIFQERGPLMVEDPQAALLYLPHCVSGHRWNDRARSILVTREISAIHRGQWHGRQEVRPLALAVTLVSCKEKELVFFDRSAEGAPNWFCVNAGLPVLFALAKNEFAFSARLRRNRKRSMELIGARFRRHINHATRIPRIRRCCCWSARGTRNHIRIGTSTVRLPTPAFAGTPSK